MTHMHNDDFLTEAIRIVDANRRSSPTCEQLKALDAKYGIPPGSELHHDRCCAPCADERARMI